MTATRAIAAAALLLATTACAAPVGKVSVDAAPPSPLVRSQTNRVNIHYRLNAPGTVSTRIVGADGQAWVVHANAVRPTPGDYVLQFDGTVAGPGPNERRVLPDGDYQVVLDVDAAGQHNETQVSLAIRDADATPPSIDALAVLPDRISPNFDALDDVTHLTYRIDKPATVSAFLDTGDAATPKRVWTGEESQVTPGEQSLTWDGTANGQPVPSGTYLLGIRARDQAGNVVEQSTPMTIDDSGMPEATIASVQIGPLQITRGSDVCVDALVRNTGQTVLRTEGPEPGYEYNSLDTYASIENHQFVERAGFWRVGLNWSGSTDTNGATYPYRWGFGHDLQPGEVATVHGCVRVLNEQDQLVFFAGLVQENVAIHSAGAGAVRVTIS